MTTHLTTFLSQFSTDLRTFFKKSCLITSSRYKLNVFWQFLLDKFLDFNLIWTQPLQNRCFWTVHFLIIFKHIPTQLVMFAVTFCPSRLPQSPIRHGLWTVKPYSLTTVKAYSWVREYFLKENPARFYSPSREYSRSLFALFAKPYSASTREYRHSRTSLYVS